MSALLEAVAVAIPGRIGPLDLNLAAGTLTALCGPNGSGKTSLLHTLAGIGSATGGVRIAGRAVETLTVAERPRLLAFLPTSREVAWPLNGRDLIALGGATEEEIEAVTTALTLEAVIHRPVDRLSTGERRRVLLARALATTPRLLLLDEPVSNLDPLWQIRVMELLRKAVRRNGQAALVAMHDLDAAARFADRMIVMEHGRIAADGKPAELIAGPAIRTVFGVERGEDGWREAAGASG